MREGSTGLLRDKTRPPGRKPSTELAKREAADAAERLICDFSSTQSTMAPPLVT